MASLRRTCVVLAALTGALVFAQPVIAIESDAAVSPLLLRADQQARLMPTASDGSFMIVSDRKKTLAIRSPFKAKSGQEVRLDRACNLSIPECRWILRDGMLISAANPSMAIKAWGGAQHSTILRLNNACATNNPDCVWIINKGMLTSQRDPRLSINAWGGAEHGISLRLHNECKPNNPDCTWSPVK